MLMVFRIWHVDFQKKNFLERRQKRTQNSLHVLMADQVFFLKHPNKLFEAKLLLSVLFFRGFRDDLTVSQLT